MISEAEFYTEILEDFICVGNVFKEGNILKEKELWRSTSIIKLMQVSNEMENQEIIEDGLKIILNLSELKKCGELLDSYEIDSFSINELIEPEKKELMSILKLEFT